VRVRKVSREFGLAAVAVAGVVALVVPSAVSAAAHSPVTIGGSYRVLGDDVFAVAVDSVSHLAYVGGDAGTHHTEVIDTRTGARTDLNLASADDSIAVNEATGLVYIPDEVSGTVAVLNRTSVVNTITLPAGSETYDATIDSATGLVYVDEFGRSAVAVIKGTTLVKTITVGKGPEGGAVDPGTGDVYIPNAGDGTVSVIRGKTVINTVTVGTGPDFVAVDPTRHLAYVANEGAGTVSILHGSTLQHTVTVGDEPDGIAVDPATHLAYVGNFGSSSVSILDGKTVKATIPVGDAPYIPAFDPTNGLVVFPSAGSSAIAVFAGTKLVQRRTTAQAGNAVAGVDTSNGRTYVTSEGGDAITALQTPTLGTITIKRPTHRHYRRGAKVYVKFSCKRGTNNTVTSCKGSTGNGHRLSTTKTGVHHFTVTLHQAYGGKIKKKITYHVVKK
jgi:YVTN family beta-propeller protein